MQFGDPIFFEYVLVKRNKTNVSISIFFFPTNCRSQILHKATTIISLKE